MRVAFRKFAIALLAAALSGCATYDDPYYVHSVWGPASATNAAWDVFYLTDRNIDRNMPGGFGYEPGQGISCGVLHASVPPARMPGDAGKFATESGRDSLACGAAGAEIANAIVKQAHAKNCRSVLIYVHGFDTGFETAVLRAAQIAGDTQWPCVTAAFSWSSSGKRDTYEEDNARVDAAIPAFANFLNALANAGLRTNIVAHSIGAKLVLKSLGTNGSGGLLADQVVFAAPDIGVAAEHGEFAEMNRAAAPHYRRLTIYASDEDVALAISRRLNHGVPRLGRDPKALRGTGADVIDASDAPGEFWGHNYFDFSYELLSDMSLALAGVPVQARLQPRMGAAPTLLPGDDGFSYRLNVSSSRAPDIFTRVLRWLVSAIAG